MKRNFVWKSGSTYLIVVGEGDNARTNTENHAWMDFAVGPSVGSGGGMQTGRGIEVDLGFLGLS